MFEAPSKYVKHVAIEVKRFLIAFIVILTIPGDVEFNKVNALALGHHPKFHKAYFFISSLKGCLPYGNIVIVIKYPCTKSLALHISLFYFGMYFAIRLAILLNLKRSRYRLIALNRLVNRAK